MAGNFFIFALEDMIIENIKIMRFILMKPKGGRVFLENISEFTIQVKKKFGKTFLFTKKG